MNLDLTEEQQALQGAVRRLLRDKCPTQLVREMEKDPAGYPETLWRALSDIGLPGLTLPEWSGGLAENAIAMALVYEEFGRSLCPSPHLASSVIAAGLIARAGSEEQKRHWLPTLASGETVLTVALLEPGNDESPAGIQLAARRVASGLQISGTKYCVLHAGSTHGLLSFVRNGPQERDIDLLLIDPKASGIKLRRTPTLAGDAQYVVEFDAVTVQDSQRVGAPGSAWNHWESLQPEIRIATAAWAIGCAERALEMATTYAKEREQFDRPIGSFQGIAHPLATVAMEIQGARALVHQAAWVLSTQRPAAQLAAMAKLQADAANRHATAVGHQTLGGIGFTLDIDMQLYYRRAKQSQLTWGRPVQLEQEIATGLLGEPTHGL